MRVRSLAGFLLVAAGRLASFEPVGSQSSDLVDRADRTTSGSSAAMGEWRSGALGWVLCAEIVVA